MESAPAKPGKLRFKGRLTKKDQTEFAVCVFYYATLHKYVVTPFRCLLLILFGLFCFLNSTHHYFWPYGNLYAIGVFLVLNYTVKPFLCLMSGLFKGRGVEDQDTDTEIVMTEKTVTVRPASGKGNVYPAGKVQYWKFPTGFYFRLDESGNCIILPNRILSEQDMLDIPVMFKRIGS